MRVAIDTNRYSDAVRGDADVVATLAAADQVFVPYVVLGELRYGFMHGTKLAANERQLRVFLSSPRVGILFADEKTTHIYAHLSVQLRHQGTPIPSNDIWIAALTVQHGLHLYARDKHFDFLSQLLRV